MAGPYEFIPGVPAAGHMTTGGYWHPGPINGCSKCGPPRPFHRWKGNESMQRIPWTMDFCLACGVKRASDAGGEACAKAQPGT